MKFELKHYRRRDVQGLARLARGPFDDVSLLFGELQQRLALVHHLLHLVPRLSCMVVGE